jgi:hypothetical protein
MHGAVFWALALGIHAIWVAAAPGVAARVLALAGLAGSFGLAIACAPGRASIWAVAHPRQLATSRPLSVAVLAVFLLPAVALRPFTIAFWILDPAAALICSWIAVLGLVHVLDESAGNPESSGARHHLPIVSSLFIAWTAALWLTVVLDLGIGRYVVMADRTVNRYCQSDPLTDTFEIWRAQPASEHLFLGWRTAEAFETRNAYANHVHPYLFAMYAWSTSIEWLTGLPLYVATNTTPLFYAAVLVCAFILLISRMGLLSGRQGPTKLLALFLATGFLMTTWRFWNDLYRYNSDNPYPFLAGGFIIVYSLLLAPPRPLAAPASTALAVALSPIHTPMLMLAAACVFGTPASGIRALWTSNRVLRRALVWAAVAGLTTAFLPRVLIAWKEYHPVGSSFLFRSGLDGDTTYFQNLLQAAALPCAANCCYGRPPAELLFPAFLPAALLFWLTRPLRGSSIAVGQLLLFTCTPYVVSLILFPQSVSIHPYLYDHLLILPVVVAGAAAAVTPAVVSRLRGPGLLVFLLFSGALIMANLLALAQGIARMP